MGNLLSTLNSNTGSSPSSTASNTPITTSKAAARAIQLAVRASGHTMNVITTAMATPNINTGARTLDTLPIEIIELITITLPSLQDVFSLRLVSRALRNKSEHPFGTEYFSGLNFQMHPHNLRALEELATTRMAKYVKVLGIQFPHNSAICPVLIDPMHDSGVAGNCVSNGPNGETHNDSKRSVKTLAELVAARMAADIATLKQALARMPKLLEVRTGNFADEQLRGLQTPIHIPPRMAITCVTGQCRPAIRLRYEQLYHIVVAAVASTVRPAGEEVVLSISVNPSSPRIDLLSTTKTLLKNVRTRAQINFDDPQKNIYCSWLSEASLEALEMRYSRWPGDPPSPLPNITAPLKSLTILQSCFSSKGVVSGLTALWRPVTKDLLSFLNHHKDTLETVRLLQCRMVKGDAHDPGLWLPILGKLKEMKKLAVLEIDRLKSEPNAKDHLSEDQTRRADVQLHWAWKKRQVREALEKLEQTHQTVTVREWRYLNLYAATLVSR